mmetsp:Transcript_108213/g.304922  ORF Transcript_108213/g.304922 Transcript_108213/m.304922 type:complete len:240 (+) Transcript_108213:315-1034(+)
MPPARPSHKTSANQASTLAGSYKADGASPLRTKLSMPWLGATMCPSCPEPEGSCEWPWPCSWQWPTPSCWHDSSQHSLRPSGFTPSLCGCSSSAASEAARRTRSNAFNPNTAAKSTTARVLSISEAVGFIATTRCRMRASAEASGTRSTLLRTTTSAHAICLVDSASRPRPPASPPTAAFPSPIEDNTFRQSTKVMTPSKYTRLPSSSSTQKISQMASGSAIPVASTSTYSKRWRSSKS